MTDRSARVIDTCRQISRMTEEPGRITRRFLTPPVKDVHALFAERMRALGMLVRVDAIGNLRGEWAPARALEQRLVIGSHVDTVPDAGAFDGVLGVAIALEWVDIAREHGLAIPIEVIAFSEEEGARFGVPFLGSRAVAGNFDPALFDLRDPDGITVRNAIRAFGLDPSSIDSARLTQNVLGFVEIHMEQGPVLDNEGLSVAAVAAIVGQTRGALHFNGTANHAGTTPMNLRRDALAAAAEWLLLVEQIARGTPQLVATVGRMEVSPNAANVIPGAVRMTLDCRHPDDAARRDAVSEMLRGADEIASRRGVPASWSLRMEQPAVPLDPQLTDLMALAIKQSSLPPRRLVSGAGHDAMIMASIVPSTMLFLRSPGGVSHHPSETVLPGDIDAALNVAREFLTLISSTIG